jgi:uncharacterized membrane protein
MENEKSAIGLDANLTAAIGYPVGILALILIFIEKENKFIRFHAIQSVIWGVCCGVLFFVLMILGMILALILSMISPSLGGLVWVLTVLLYLVLLLGWVGGMIMGAVKSYGNEMYKLPIVGNFAEKWSA